MRFETKIYNYSADEKIIGAEVTVYDEEGDKIDSIVVTDETQLQELEEALETIDSRYVLLTALNDILANIEETNNINATKLNGHQGDAFVLLADIQNNVVSANPKPHASQNSATYGAGTTTNFGHVKLRDNLGAANYVSGEALASHQGKVLDDKIAALKAVTNSPYIHSTMKVRKSGSIVWFNVKEWNWNQGDATGTMLPINVTIPEGYRPVDDLYVADVRDSGLRMHINTSGNITAIRDSSTTRRTMTATVMWMTNE